MNTFWIEYSTAVREKLHRWRLHLGFFIIKLFRVVDMYIHTVHTQCFNVTVVS